MEKKPDGIELLKILIELYADQEGLKIEYKIEKKGEHIETHTDELLLERSESQLFQCVAVQAVP